MSGACDGLRVIDFTWWMAGPLATMTLADCGATVIKVEPPDGDPARDLPAFQTWNRGKQSVALDLKTADGRARAHELVLTADVVVVGFRPGVVERLGIGYEQVRAINPKAIYASITGFGDGKFSRLKGYEPLVAAKSGRMTVYERIADRPGPGFSTNPYCSFSAAMLLTQAILAALHRRRETGTGQAISVSMLGAILPFDLHTWINPQLSPATPDPSKDKKRFAVAIGRTYDSQRLRRPEFRVPRPSIWCGVTKDGVWFWIENTAQHLCVTQMTALNLLHLYQDERFAQLPAVANEQDGEALWEILLERVRSKTYEEWRETFEGLDMGWERLSSGVEALRHRQVIHNGHSVEIPGLHGERTLQPGPLVRFSESETRCGKGAPRLDEHDEQSVIAGDEATGNTPATSAAMSGGAGPLAGLTVLDLSTWLAGAFAPTLLAELGARVISVEPLGGEPGRYLIGGMLAFVTSQGKESIAVDLKQSAGREIVERLIKQADIVYHNYRTGVPERLGLDYDSCKALNPNAIYVHASAYGDSGPDNRRPAFAGTMAALNGYAVRQAGGQHPVAGSQALEIEDLKQEAWRLANTVDGAPDINAALASATAVLLGLYARDRGGTGQALMTTMVCSNMHANSDDLIDYEGRPPAPRADEELFGLGPLYRLYEASDGWVFLACPRRKEWDAFCAAVKREGLRSAWDQAWREEGSDEQRALADTIGELIRARPAAEWERFMTEHDVPLVAVELRDPGVFSLEEGDLKAQGLMVQVESPEHGPYWRHGALHQFSSDELHFGAWEPVGGHTRPILAELGYDTEEVERLVNERIVEVPTET